MPAPHSQPPFRQDDRVAEFFCDSWSIYAHVLDHNYMFHDDIYRNVHGFLATRFGARPFTLLDLGCGSARHLAAALQGLAVARYRGYDLSAVAVEHARRNLDGLPCPVDVRLGDLLDAVGMERDAYDLVFSSFALHHLHSRQKAEFFCQAAAHLQPGGALLLVDVMRDEGEDPGSYLDRYCNWLDSHWTTLPPEARAQICAHVRDNDFPETAGQLEQFAAAAGLRPGIELPGFLHHRTSCWESAVLR